MTLQIDARKLTSSELVQQWLVAKLNLPAYYGRNMDALYDLLVSWEQPMVLELLHWDELGMWGLAFLKTVRDATAVNPNITCLHD